ncbi:hypothetical protein FRC17_009793 [Serendipita sp. 399]|nr:hypothetical protein FRC17_009793 [Serendipita sp. 399]
MSGKLSTRDAENAALFLKSQRTHKTLLDRYNPLHDLTAEEHIKATAKRVGLNMPIEVKDSEAPSAFELIKGILDAGQLAAIPGLMDLHIPHFPGHYPSSGSPATTLLINLGDQDVTQKAFGLDGLEMAGNPEGSTLLTSPLSEQAREPPISPPEDIEPDIVTDVSQRSPTPALTPTYNVHPRFDYPDGTLVVMVENYLFKIHAYLFLPSDGNFIAENLKDGLGTNRSPIVLPPDVRIGGFEHLLQILYRHPLDRSNFRIRPLKDAYMTANALHFVSFCNLVAKYIVDNDCVDEPLDEAVPKYDLATKFPHHFPSTFREAQLDKLCCSVQFMSHSHFYELGFMELAKIWKVALAARAGYDGSKTEIFEPPSPPSRTSYLLKVKNPALYRAAKREMLGPAV